LIKIQEKLFTVGAILATAPKKEKKLNIAKIAEADITFLEEEIDAMNELLPQMTHFILPGGHQTVSYCHIARTVCRRGERIIALLNENEPQPERLLAYVNRLSDFLFVLARKLSKQLQADEVKWVPEKLD